MRLSRLKPLALAAAAASVFAFNGAAKAEDPRDVDWWTNFCYNFTVHANMVCEFNTYYTDLTWYLPDPGISGQPGSGKSKHVVCCNQTENFSWTKGQRVSLSGSISGECTTTGGDKWGGGGSVTYETSMEQGYSVDLTAGPCECAALKVVNIHARIDDVIREWDSCPDDFGNVQRIGPVRWRTITPGTSTEHIKELWFKDCPGGNCQPPTPPPAPPSPFYIAPPPTPAKAQLNLGQWFEDRGVEDALSLTLYECRSLVWMIEGQRAALPSPTTQIEVVRYGNVPFLSGKADDLVVKIKKMAVSIVESKTFGDIDGNGAVNASDYAALVDAVANGANDIKSRRQDDLNGDDRIDAADLVVLQGILAP